MNSVLLGVEKAILATAFPTQWLVIGVPVTSRRLVEELRRSGLRQTTQTRLTWHGRHLDRHAWVALVALVMAARRGRPKPAFLLK
jgi:carbonic anhydrase/acetyltransferase-like protein (isoleucine patch superfamily)